MSLSVKIDFRSDRGLVRRSNEDVALAKVLPGGTVLLAVADGVGGHPGGDVAAAAAVAELEARLEAALDPVAELRPAVEAANARVLAEAQANPRWHGMASTLVAAVISGEEASIANVGDSRAYVMRNGTIAQITRDHTLASDYDGAAGQLESIEWLSRVARHVITRAIGREPTVEVDICGPIPMPGGSTLLLCSDGLHGQVSDEVIAQILATDGEDANGALVARANIAGGRDNVAVALARFGSPIPELEARP